MAADIFRTEPLPAPESAAPSCRAIIDAPQAGWSQVAMGEWELRGCEFGDRHPHDELNYVLAGHLVVECDGSTVHAWPGDVVRVPAGSAAYYRTPEYARMVYVYGPNPDGQASAILRTGPARDDGRPGPARA
ncbi:MAG: cupin domain-containing protein [Mycobacteriales bacterium]